MCLKKKRRGVSNQSGCRRRRNCQNTVKLTAEPMLHEAFLYPTDIPRRICPHPFAEKSISRAAGANTKAVAERCRFLRDLSALLLGSLPPARLEALRGRLQRLKKLERKLGISP